MKLRFVKKTFAKRDGYVMPINIYAPSEDNAIQEVKKEEPAEPKVSKNKKTTKKKNDMDANERINAAAEVLSTITPEVKVVKKERGLIERTESSKIILTEDNRQVLND